MNHIKHLLIYIILAVATVPALAQPTKIRGTVIDATTKEPIPFASVVFVGTTIGASTDFDGNYFLETREDVDSVEISYIGYLEQIIPVNKHGFKTINVALQENTAMLDEVVIVADKHRENPTHRIIRGIIANKKRNNPERSNSFQYDSYTKMEMSLTNINEKFKKKKLLKDFNFVFDYVDTSALTGKAYLPFMISETKSEVYHSNNPKLTKEIIKANKISGFDGDNASVSQFTGQLYQDFNIYDNYILLFEQGFISPFNSSGLLFYKYYLTDSIQRDNKLQYNISFQPKNPKDATFTGEFWVTADDFAVTSVKMRINNKVNVNWVNDVMISEEFNLMEDSIWFWKNRKLTVDFMLLKKDTTQHKGFLGTSTIHFDNVVFNKPMPEQFAKAKNNILIDAEVYEKGDDYWDEARPYELSKSEKGIYEMVDSIKSVPIYQTYVDIISTVLTGYYDFGDFEIGPYYKLLSFNDIEGTRFQFGGRTTSDFSSKIRLSGHLAYGTDDNEWKYGIGTLYKFSEKNDLWESASVNYTHDMEQLGKGSSPFLTAGNILASLLSRGDTDKLTLQNELNLNYEKEWVENFSTKLTFRYKELIPSDYVPFTPANDVDNLIGESIKTNEIELSTRWSPRAKVIRRTFSRMQITSSLPILNLKMAVGLGDYKYQKVDFLMEHTLPVYPIGHTYYTLRGGKIFGDAPFPLLHLHEGNETYVYDTYAYNLMDYYEFASDTYASIGAEHHFMGFLFNKIPLLKKMNLRTVVTGKALWGTLSDNNNRMNAPLLFPEGLSDLSKPYFEAGVGIENIFKIARIDAVWRLSHRDTRSDIDKFGIRATLQLTF
ncbi:carboxypeptidase-like protein [Balneicella halophila]|uniref:Carboxypeptidase-like protein n=1 Tax=Balneicella halophila TaxID=1537566 RepID=A0A7L4UQ10_BALHA|nr:DUF5686 family protein [Balneicella halophila]PVX50896.1 carboxypeptidase-like protein [Balneicella halophila]